MGGAEVWRPPCGLLDAAGTEHAGERAGRNVKTLLSVGTQQRALSPVGQARVGVLERMTEAAVWEAGCRG